MSAAHGVQPLVELSGVSKVFGWNEHTRAAVRDVSLEARRGELVLLLGPSGSGKTTLLTLIAGLVQPTQGVVRLFGRPLEGYAAAELQRLRAEAIGFVFQTFLLLDALTVRENVELVLRFAGKSRAESRKMAARLLAHLKIGSLAGRFPATLSQGEKQRVAVARAVANDAELILADEPTASLETAQGFEIIQLLHRYAKVEKRCVVVASHDLRLVECADRVLHLQDGMLVGESGS